MATSTYSFNDVITVISHPSFPAYTMNGQGVGEISISYMNDNTSHDLAADGSVMVSKIKANNANITITMQQTSPLHKWFKQFFNYLQGQPTVAWAAASLMISSPAGTLDTIMATGVSISKRADQPYQAQGQMVTWSLMAASVKSQL